MLMASGQLDPEPLITHRFQFDTAPAAYDLISGSEPSLGILLQYPDRGGAIPAPAARTRERVRQSAEAPAQGVIGVIGAGNFAVRTLLPALRDAGARLRTIASGGGTSGEVSRWAIRAGPLARSAGAPHPLQPVK